MQARIPKSGNRFSGKMRAKTGCKRAFRKVATGFREKCAPKQDASAHSEKWQPVFGKNASQNKSPERLSGSVTTKIALTHGA